MKKIVLTVLAIAPVFIGYSQKSKGFNDLALILNEVIAIDGKTLYNSFDKASGTKAIHMVSAFATGARLVLAQQKVAEKSNEITAIPLLLKLLSLKDNITCLCS